MSKAYISKLRIYPVKSLGYVEIDEVEIGIHSLKNDRLFAMKDENGRYINGKRTPRVHDLKSEFDLSKGLILLSDKAGGPVFEFELKEENEDLNKYLSDFFELKIELVKNEEGGFQDIPVESSVTIVSEASLQSLQKDIDRHSLENMRSRFRTNVELGGVEAFWEEKLFDKPGVGVRFRMGEVEMFGISPRARCNVPPQNPETGEMDYDFVKSMINSRNSHTETAADLLQYGRSTYFLTINVFVQKTEFGKKIKLNDEIEIFEKVSLS